MKKTIFSLFFLGAAAVLFGQVESLNQLDSAGKKHGKWILYLDSEGGKVKDSTQAVFYRYTYYDQGLHIHPMGKFISKNWTMESSGSSAQTDKLQILDGEYRCFDTKKRLRYVHTFKNGEYVSYKEFYKSGELHTLFDYTKKCEGQPHSWCIFMEEKNGT